MRIIVGLGNPGAQYQNTRHNVGFLAVDFMAKTLGISFRAEKKFQAEIAEALIGKEKVLLVKPLTFMNCSGETVRALIHFYKEDLANLMVIHDDLDIKASTYKTTLSSRAAGNNGVQDIIDALGTQDFHRIRIGVGRPVDTLGVCIPSHDYVLSPLTTEEQEKLEALFPTILETVTQWIQR